ncbi:MAG: Adenylate/guanylate cyclase [Verrucomicrobiales bacterium]|jgi:adenylate cyclase|nr:Adenylate/guanylate cyclase [Verrucomicrobiales bacterium]
MITEFPSAKTTPGPRLSCQGYVLVVDDEEQNRLLLRDPLEARGYQVDEAASGMEALQKIAEHLPDAVLLDLMMPHVDGFEVCRQIKNEAKTAHIPVLMVTALSERKEKLMGIAAGANDFLTKPVDIQDLILRVRNAVQMTQLHTQLEEERNKSERLLLNVLPLSIAERMKNGEATIADSYADVTVLVADLIGFTALASHIDPEQIVNLLNEVFTAFDVLTEDRGLEKIKTIGDAYMVGGGLLLPRADHVESITELALDMQEEIEKINQRYDTSIRIRIGISTGPVIAGVIGRKRFAFDLWGEAVSTAFHLGSAGDTGSIQIAESTFERLKDKFQCEKHSVEVKERGVLSTWLLGPRI